MFFIPIAAFDDRAASDYLTALDDRTASDNLTAFDDRSALDDCNDQNVIQPPVSRMLCLHQTPMSPILADALCI